MNTQKSKTRIGIGALSGTSVDGIDVGLVKIHGSGESAKVKLLAFETYPFSTAIRAKILKSCDPLLAALPELAQLHFLIGELFADAIQTFLTAYRPKRLDFIASHGQTVWHNPKRERIGKFHVGSSLQLGEGAIIANRLGVLTMSNFRAAEFAFGKDGAPLAPYLDYLLFRSSTKNRLLINIGGISNLTALKANAQKRDVIFFDSGAGNILLDKATQHFFGKPFDGGGRLASKGSINPTALNELLSEPFYKRKPPKSTGRELYNDAYFQRTLALCRNDSPNDVLATLVELAAESLYRQYAKFIAPQFEVDEVIVSGGGAKNHYLMKRLQMKFANARVMKQDDLQDCSIPAKAKEAVLFAVLGNELLSGNSASMQTPAILGVVHLPPIKRVQK